GNGRLHESGGHTRRSARIAHSHRRRIPTITVAPFERSADHVEGGCALEMAGHERNLNGRSEHAEHSDFRLGRIDRSRATFAPAGYSGSIRRSGASSILVRRMAAEGSDHSPRT